MSIDVSAHADLFILDWPTDPERAVVEARARGISEPRGIEMSAWCAELHEQLRLLADERGMPLLLMGGHAAALRLEAAVQRGSKDNDYLTTATEPELVALMDALQERFAPHFAEPYFRHRRLHGGADAEPLPLAAFAVDVPALITPTEELLAVKIEFHIEDDPDLFPEGEAVEGSFFGLAETVHAQLPQLPYQIALKLMTLHDDPVGLAPTYEAAVPRQMWDVDVLAAKLRDAEQFQLLADYSRRRYIKEEQQRGRSPEDDGPWAGIERRLGQWSPPSDDQWSNIERFQNSQITRASRRPREQWAARVARLRLLARILATPDYATWKRILQVEKLIPEPAGKELRTIRNQVASVIEAPPRSLGQYPRRAYWEHLKSVSDISGALDAFERALTPAS